ncbi:hypothetical protein MCOR25_008059 [Pyricularia grisea]|nr:hypothetical protein MCOR25_008059 [Pyricularia grisea]
MPRPVRVTVGNQARGRWHQRHGISNASNGFAIFVRLLLPVVAAVIFILDPGENGQTTSGRSGFSSVSRKQSPLVREVSWSGRDHTSYGATAELQTLA